MISVSSQSQTPSGYIRGFEFVTLSHSLEVTHSRRSKDCNQPRTSNHTSSCHTGASEKMNQRPKLIRISKQHFGSTNQTQKISHHHDPVPVAASHQLSQIDFCFSPFRPMVPGHSQALQLFLPFLAARCAPCSCAW